MNKNIIWLFSFYISLFFANQACDFNFEPKFLSDSDEDCVIVEHLQQSDIIQSKRNKKVSKFLEEQVIIKINCCNQILNFLDQTILRNNQIISKVDSKPIRIKDVYLLIRNIYDEILILSGSINKKNFPLSVYQNFFYLINKYKKNINRFNYFKNVLSNLTSIEKLICKKVIALSVLEKNKEDIKFMEENFSKIKSLINHNEITTISGYIKAARNE